MRVILIFLFFYFFTFSNIKGQGTTIIRFDDDTTNLEIKTDSKGNKKLVSKKKKSFPKNNIKVGLLSAAYGCVPVYYERYITDFLTIQGSVGLTFRDFIGNFYPALTFGKYRTRYNDNPNWNYALGESDVDDDYYFFATRKSGFGVSISAAPRFFVTSDYFDGFYISPEVEYAIRTYKAQMVDSAGYADPSRIMKEKVNNIYFHLNFGWERDFDPVTLDFSFSLGFTKSKEKRLDTGYKVDTYGNYVYLNKERSLDRMYPYFRLNLALGGLFGKK